MLMCQCEPDFSHNGVLIFHSSIFVLLWCHINGINWRNSICISRLHYLKVCYFPNSFLTVLFAHNWYSTFYRECSRVLRFSVTLLQEVCFSFKQSIWHYMYLSMWILDSEAFWQNCYVTNRSCPVGDSYVQSCLIPCIKLSSGLICNAIIT